MLYLASFSFDGHATDGGHDDPAHGCFTCAVDADSVEKAVEELAVLIERLRGETDLFKGVERIFLDACIECRRIPEQGFIAHFTQYRGAMPSSVSTALQGADPEDCDAYVWGAGEDGEAAQEEDETPFLTFARE